MMNQSPQFDVLDLRHFSAAQLRPLLYDQAERWERRLNWDYRSSIELLLQYIDSRTLPGFAAVVHGHVIGYTFSVLEATKGVIGDVYAFGESEKLENPVCETLLKHLTEMLQATPGVERAEAQLMMFPSGALTNVLLPSGFSAHPRLYMQWNFAVARPTNPLRVPPGLRLLPWRPEFYEAAALLIHRSYQGHVDSGINDQYRSLDGSQRFLHNVIRFPGCGIFQAENSWVLIDERHRLQGLLLSSRIRQDVGHITQLCISPELHGQGLGRLLLTQCGVETARRGGQGLTLTVTEANLYARRLYDELGFETLHRFDALIWNKHS
jgi:GNAT superfamily N-acetyltransferase